MKFSKLMTSENILVSESVSVGNNIINSEYDKDIFLDNISFLSALEENYYKSSISLYDMIMESSNDYILKESVIGEVASFIKDLFVKAIKYIYDSFAAVIKYIKGLFTKKNEAYKAVDDMSSEDESKISVTITGYRYTIDDTIPDLACADSFITETMAKMKDSKEQINAELFCDQFRGCLVGLNGSELSRDEFIDNVVAAYRNGEFEPSQITYLGSEIKKLREFEKSRLLSNCEKIQKEYVNKLNKLKTQVQSDLSNISSDTDKVKVANLLSAKKFINSAITDMITIMTGKAQAIKDQKKQNDRVMVEAKRELAKIGKVL